ncbi:12-(S)-hydroxy-5,8,10,14-eicosatetraenoic acid receptor-like [Eucyclogobius newberryi]|uniref:12-(S)-hydroxy-5,8,10,14-eicosatetraenoic acid receptor-like n=1 Tax=Eucyclogobius newberryi TaxID=166745 RepID=UPI003B5AB166
MPLVSGTPAPQGDNCTTPNELTYQILSGVMIGQFVLGLPLNLSVLYIFIFRYRFWKNKSIFLFNIVVADFLLVVCLPVKAYHYLQHERHSPNMAMCKTMLFMLFLNRGASIAFLIMLSLDRYFNVVHLGRKNCVKFLKKTPQISVVIWLLLLPLTVPTMMYTFECCNSHGRTNETDISNAIDTFREVVFFTQIIIPFIILVFCTVRIVRRLKRKTVGDKTKLRRAVLVVLSVVCVFSSCFLPCAIARAALLYVRVNDMESENMMTQIYDSLMVLSFIDCLLDPLVYCFCNTGFKNAYISNFCPAFLKEKLLTTDFGMGVAATSTYTNSGERIIH